MHPCTSANHHFLLTTAPTTPRAVILLTTQAQTTSSRPARSTAIPHPPCQPRTNPSHTARPHTHPPQSQRRRPARHTPRPLLSHLRHGAAKSRKQYHASTVHPQLPTYRATTLFAPPLFIKPNRAPVPETGNHLDYLVGLVLLLYRRASFVPSFLVLPHSLSLSRARAQARHAGIKVKAKRKKHKEKNNHWRCCCWYTLEPTQSLG
jgi:hypothetical protein